MKFEAINQIYTRLGRSIDLDRGDYDEIVIQGCTFNGCGIFILPKENAKITITNCTATNIMKGKEEYGNFVQVAGPENGKPVIISLLISGNTVFNEPGKSDVEDNINLFNVTGSKPSPLIIENNKITGAYPYPLPKGVKDPMWKAFSGSGIMIDKNSSWVVVRGNRIKDTINCGIGVASGCHNRVGHNIVRTECGYNVGIYSSGFNYPKDPFIDNKVANNDVVWQNFDGKRNDYWLP